MKVAAITGSGQDGVPHAARAHALVGAHVLDAWEGRTAATDKACFQSCGVGLFFPWEDKNVTFLAYHMGRRLPLFFELFIV